MEKLIEILNKYQEEKNSEIRFKRIDNSDFFVCWDDVWLGYETILSKKFWFIKWLVDNDKIDTIKVDEDRLETIQYSEKERITIYNWLLMLLSISSSPIDDLLSYLK